MATEHFPAPNAGQAFRTAAPSLRRNEALELVNLLTHERGKAVVRGPFAAATSLFASSTGVAGYWRHGNNLLFGPTAGGVSSNRHVVVNAGSYTVTNVTTTDSNHQIEGRSAVVDKFAYGPAASSSVNKAILSWDGTATQPVQRLDGPRDATDVAAYVSRLFVAGGSVPGTTTPVKDNAIYWSDLGGPTTNTLADWQDDVSGLVNQIEVGSAGDPIVALAPLQNQLVVFKRNSIYVIRGRTPSTFQVERVADTLGCVSARCVLVFDDVVVFVSDNGVELYDGVQFASLGGPNVSEVEPALGTAPTLVRLPRDYIMLHGHLPTHRWLLHLPTRAWSQVTCSTNILGSAASAWLMSTEQGRVLVFDGRYVRRLEGLTANETQAGRESILTSASTYELIAAKWKTRLARLSLPTRQSVIRYVEVDHKTATVDGPAATPNWQVQLTSGSTAFTPLQVNPSDASHDRHYAQHDLFGEAADIIVTVTLTSSGAPDQLTAAELHDLWIDYEPAQR